MEAVVDEDLVDYPSCPICGMIMEPPMYEWSPLDATEYCVCNKCGHVLYYKDAKYE